MDMKRCLFCDKAVTLQQQGDYERYVGCLCAPDSHYHLRLGSYDSCRELSNQTKREWFPIISAYIRELSDSGETVVISFGDLEKIVNSPDIPTTIEEKSVRLLHYLRRHSKGPGEPVVIHRLSESYNLTYSQSLQETVYIIEKLKEELMIERIGSTFKLTEEGWRIASDRAAGGGRLKPCFIYLSDEQRCRAEWAEKVLPTLQQQGYMPHLPETGPDAESEEDKLRQISESKLLIADLTGQSPEAYFAAGLAIGMQIPVIVTVHEDDAGNCSVPLKPHLWEKTEDIAVIMQRSLSD